jgi:hypothetical protein
MPRSSTLGVAFLLLHLAYPAASGAQVRESYDRFTDRTTVTLFLLYDAPMFGPTKEVNFIYYFGGKVQTSPADTVAFVVKLMSVGTAEISAGGWKLADRPPLYVLVDDTLRLQYETVAWDWNSGLLGGIGYKLDETVAYALPTADLLRILSGSSIAFKVGPWERQFKPKEVAKLRALATRLTNIVPQDGHR